MPLAGLATGDLTWRRLGVLVAQLPSDSAVAVATLGPQATWTATDYLLANVVDLLHVLVWQNSGGKRGTQPQPIPRPGGEAAEAGPSRLSLAEHHARLVDQQVRERARHAAELVVVDGG